MLPGSLDLQIAAYEQTLPKPENADTPVVVFYDGAAQAWFKSVVDAYLWAKDRFPANQYLVRDVNEETPFLPLLVVTCLDSCGFQQIKPV